MERKAGAIERDTGDSLISSISTNFTRLSTDEVNGGIDWAVQTLGELLGVDRSYVFLLSDDGRQLSNTHEWCADGIECQIENSQRLPARIYPWWMDRLNRLEIIRISRLDDLPQEAITEKQTLHAKGVRSLLLVPIVRENSLGGFVGLDSVRTERTWSAKDLETLTTVGELVANALGCKRARDEKEELQNQLRQVQKMGEIGQLSGGLAHDFNNVLQTILGYTEINLRYLSPLDRVHRDLQKIRQAAGRAAELTQKLLAFSRWQMIRPADIDLNNLITDVSKMLPRVIGEHIELKTKFGSRTATVHADAGSLEQVLLNLCVNARDAMVKGGELTLETSHAVLDRISAAEHPGAHPGTYELLSVTDTGVGMSKEVMEQIFEPFFTTKEVGKGTGLGLSMVHGTVKQHEGFIQCHSEPGKGTRFDIYLPSMNRSMKRHGTEDVSSANATQAIEGTETILLAEDDHVVRELAVRVLQDGGYKVLSAKDGMDAVRVFGERADAIDLALLDIVMPKMSGQDVYDRIVGIKPEICVLFSSGYGTSVTGSSFFAERGLETIRKPYTPQALLQKVRDVLDAEGTRAQAGIDCKQWSEPVQIVRVV